MASEKYSIKIKGTFEAVYISKPKDGKPVYVQCLPQGLKYPEMTFSFPRAVCPVTAVGQIFSAEMTGEYNVFHKPAGVKDSHNFVIFKVENLKKYEAKMTEIP